MDHEILDKILPSGLERQSGPPPPPPYDFEEGYVLPSHCEKPLQLLNYDSRMDHRLKFFEKGHIYTFDGVPTSCSGSYLAHLYQKHFDPDAAIPLMKTSRSQAWPRLEYVLDARKEEGVLPGRGCLLHCGGKTIGVLHPHNMESDSTEEDVRTALSTTRRCTPGSEMTEDEVVYSFERGMTDEEIKDLWEKKGRLASNLGTEAHYLCELFLNGLPSRWWEPEMKVLFDFVRDYAVPNGIVVHNTEKEIYSTEADMGGSVDAILYDTRNDMYIILDFKRSDKLKNDVHNSFSTKMLPPLSHLDDCRGASYSLQLGIYQYVLEKDYGLNVSDRILLSIHPDAPFVTSVPYLKAEVEFIMLTQASKVTARKKVMQSSPDRFTCCLTASPLVDAVRLKGGDLCMEKAAVLNGYSYEVDEEVRREFEDAVQSVMEKVPPPLPADCLPWKRRIPKEGIPPFS